MCSWPFPEPSYSISSLVQFEREHFPLQCISDSFGDILRGKKNEKKNNKWLLTFLPFVLASISSLKAELERIKVEKGQVSHKFKMNSINMQWLLINPVLEQRNEDSWGIIPAFKKLVSSGSMWGGAGEHGARVTVCCPCGDGQSVDAERPPLVRSLHDCAALQVGAQLYPQDMMFPHSLSSVVDEPMLPLASTTSWLCFLSS